MKAAAYFGKSWTGTSWSCLGRGSRLGLRRGSFNLGTAPVCNTAEITATFTSAVARQMTAMPRWVVFEATASIAVGAIALTTRNRIPGNLLA
jgi:hypothetical protein